MDYFEYSQEKKAEILENEEMLGNLRNHLLGIKPLSGELGKGTNNRHFSLGQLKDGLYAAVRDPIGDWKLKSNKGELEWYCQDAEDIMKDHRVKGIQNIIREYNEGDRRRLIASSFSIGVKFEFFGYWKYALVVEDLTAVGNVRYARGLGEDEGVVEGSGHKVWFDIGGICDPKGPKYMLDENMIIFQRG